MTFDIATIQNPNGFAPEFADFLMNEKGEPMQGNVYDGRGNLVARFQAVYDEFGRRKEDRLTNLKGEVFQQVLHEYDKEGKAMKPKVLNLNTQGAPMMKPAPIDFTTPGAAGGAAPGRFAPGAAPAQPSGSAPATAPAGQQPEKPKNFFKKLFKK